MDKMNKRNNRIKLPKSDLSLRIVAITVTILFTLVMLYPLIYTLSNAAKDNEKIYDMPPKLFPDAANSLSVVIDYSDLNVTDPDELLDSIMKDNALAMFSIQSKLSKESIFEIKFYGTKDQKTIFYSRAHKMKLQMEKDFGTYRNAVVKSNVLTHGDRYINVNDSIGYEFDLQGLDQAPSVQDESQFNETLTSLFGGDFKTTGHFATSTINTKNMLLLESFVYYMKMPSFIYADNPLVAKFGFFMFGFNSIIVIGWAILAQVFLCSITAFVISRLLSPKTGQIVLLYFLGAMMIPFASIMLPQLIMYKDLGFYNNYMALMLPFLYPFGFYIYLFKGFFDQIPGSYFEAARLDGANNLFLYFKICMPLSKPIISLIALQTFISNWNDFFWAWMVTENQNLWTINVALYNLSINSNTKQNVIMGLSIVSITPVILLSILFSRQLKQSIVSSGVKG